MESLTKSVRKTVNEVLCRPHLHWKSFTLRLSVDEHKNGVVSLTFKMRKKGFRRITQEENTQPFHIAIGRQFWNTQRTPGTAISLGKTGGLE